MKDIIRKIKQNYILIIVVLIIGLIIGYLVGGPSSSNQQTTTSTNQQIPESKNQIWTCSMHPQIRMDHPGKCPICGMDLIPLAEYDSEEAALNPDELRMTEEAVKIADIQTMIVKKAYPDKEVYLLGKVSPDERNIAELTARYGGRIEKLYVDFTGEKVRKGEKLASVYSPALLTAQKELLEAISYKNSNPDFYKAARNKLKLWGLSENQIEAIEKEGQVNNYFDILSPISGTITRRDVSVGDYIKEGSPLFEVIDLSKVWVMFQAYESDLPWIRLNDKVNFTIKSLPGENFSGRVNFIDPSIDPKTRVANVRVEVSNSGDKIKPEMFANGIVTSAIAGNTKDIMIPKTAVLWTGKRSVVYVKVPDREEPTFKYREITLGPTAGDFYVVAKGLEEGEEIAMNGVFKIDAASQLAGDPSMMNPEGGGGSVGSMAGMDMGGGTKKTGQAAKDSENMDTSKGSKPAVDMQFKMQLNNVFNAYLPMKNDFVDSDSKKVTTAAEKVKEKLKEVNMELLKGDAHSEWMEYLRPLNKALDKIITSDDLEIKRQGFADLNLTFI